MYPPAPKPTYGSAAEFFHTLKTDEQSRRAIIEPFHQRIMKRFRLNSREAGIVLARMVLDYLVPFFNTCKDFPTKAYPTTLRRALRLRAAGTSSRSRGRK